MMNESKSFSNIKNTLLSDKNQETKLNDKTIENYNDSEINTLSYNLALKIDKRAYCQYYFSLIKNKHFIIFNFYTNNDYNSRIIKIQ